MTEDFVEKKKTEYEQTKMRLLKDPDFDEVALRELGLAGEKKHKGKHGTTIMGAVHNNEGVLVGDTQASMGSMVATTKISKLRKIGDNFVVGGAGSVNAIWGLFKILERENFLYSLKHDGEDMTANRAASCLQTHIQRAGGVYAGFIIVGKAKDSDTGREFVTTYDVEGSGTYLGGGDTEYKTVGSGSPWAEGVMNDFFYTEIEESDQPSPSIDRLVEKTVRSVETAKRSDIYSGGGLSAYKVTLDGVTEIGWDELRETYGAVDVKRKGR